jgi:hypothetical protein
MVVFPARFDYQGCAACDSFTIKGHSELNHRVPVAGNGRLKKPEFLG